MSRHSPEVSPSACSMRLLLSAEPCVMHVVSRALDGDVLVRPGIGKSRDQPEPRLADPRAKRVDEGQLPDRRVNRLVVEELLDLVQERRALLLIQLGGLLLEKLVDVGVVAIGISAALDDIGLQAGRGVAERAAAALNDVLELFVAIRLEEGRPLEWPQPGADSYFAQVVDHRLAEVRIGAVAGI